MAKTLKLSADLSLPLNAVTEKLAFLGRTGSGKSYGAMKLAELMLAAGAQIGAIDPVGVWRSLRVPATKGGTSYDVVVFGGLYGDLPLTPLSGGLVADLVCDRGISFVLDVSQFIPSEQQKFVREFADRFFHRKKSSPSAVHLFMEECQEFIPENPSGAEAMTLGVMQRLWKLGRNFGIGGSLISQRPQEIAKKALNMSGTLFAFQMTGPQERKAIRAWVADHGVSVDIESVLQKLEVGQPHVESPTFLNMSKTVRILPRVTADLSSTPEVGASTAAKRALTPIDVEQLQTAMAETVERAKADDPKELRKQLAEVRRQLDTALKNVDVKKTSTSLQTKDVPILTDADRRLLEKIAGAYREYSTDATDDPLMAALNATVTKQLEQLTAAWFRDLQRRFAGVVQEFNRPALARIIEKLDRASAPVHLTKQPQTGGLLNTHQPTPKPLRAAIERPPARQPADAGSLTGPELKILTALAELEALGLHPADKQQLGLMAGYTNVRSGGFSEPLGRLVATGYATIPQAGRVAITDVGSAAAGSVQPPASPAEMQDRIMAKLTGPEQKLLRVIIDHYPNQITKEVLGASCGYTNIRSGGFSEPLGRLNTLGIVQTPARGSVVASPALFLEGR